MRLGLDTVRAMPYILGMTTTQATALEAIDNAPRHRGGELSDIVIAFRARGWECSHDRARAIVTQLRRMGRVQGDGEYEYLVTV